MQLLLQFIFKMFFSSESAKFIMITVLKYMNNQDVRFMLLNLFSLFFI
jgi:hypothetical protein